MIKLVLKRIPTEGGKIAFELPSEKSAIVNLIAKCKEKHNDYMLVSLETPKKPRSLPQNALLHTLIQQICNESGDDLLDMKHEIKMRAIKRGYPFTTGVLGNIKPKKSSECNTVELNLLIDECYEVGAFLGIRFIS